ncbi:hypothetical protein ACFV4M_38520 [Kitasatospora indigofera]|uniref:hypothetical protein n=1 Tax=Kitasatospora indigofera TaxID=67307 RepID=UPI0036694258
MPARGHDLASGGAGAAVLAAHRCTRRARGTRTSPGRSTPRSCAGIPSRLLTRVITEPDAVRWQQLAQVVGRTMTDGPAAAEALRLLVQRILNHQGQRLRDDATVLLVE